MFATLQFIYTFILDLIFPPSETALTLRGNDASGRLKACPPAQPTKYPFITSLFDYRDPFVEQVIWELKFYHNRDAARLCAVHIYEEIRRNKVLIPVPITKRKRRERGFNQTELICEEIVKLDESIVYVPGAVRKTRYTKNQHDMKDRLKRLENLRDAFMVNSDISGLDVIIIDDVCTTGATILEVKKVLEAAGAKSVRAVTVAH